MVKVWILALLYKAIPSFVEIFSGLKIAAIYSISFDPKLVHMLCLKSNETDFCLFLILATPIKNQLVIFNSLQLILTIKSDESR